jgi:tetratricopeptide (TPR) repeat protein
MIDQINTILKQLEASMRGKKFNDSFLSDCKDLFNWAYACFLEDRNIDQNDKVLLIESAVKMHNRAKTITNPRLSESVTYLKSTAAWILSAYAEKNTKFCILFIRLHCRIASEWIQLKAVDYAINSYREAMGSWKKLNISALDRILPQVELDTLRHTVFYGYLDLSKLLRDDASCDWSAIRACVGGALEILPQSLALRLAMAQHVLELAHHLATLLHIEESIHYFHVILTILNTPLSSTNLQQQQQQQGKQDEIPKETWQREVLLIKIKTFLGLGYLYKELNQCDKASSFITQAKELNTELSAVTALSSSPVTLANETFTFASFSIYCRDNNVASAESSLYVCHNAVKSKNHLCFIFLSFCCVLLNNRTVGTCYCSRPAVLTLRCHRCESSWRDVEEILMAMLEAMTFAPTATQPLL